MGKLYTDHFYRRLAGHLTEQGVFVVQSSSPFAARRSFWSVVTTIESVGLETLPYHAYVPSFGEWGFTLAGRTRPVVRGEIPFKTRFLNPEELQRMQSFPADMSRVPAEPNKLFDQVLVRYFQDDWSTYQGLDGN